MNIIYLEASENALLKFSIKKTIFKESIIDIAASRLLLQIKPAILQLIKCVLVGFELFLALWWLVGGGATS